MRVIRTGTSFKIYDSSIETFEQIPVGYYQVDFNKSSGFFLTVISPLELPGKVYGVHTEKAKKVLKGFRLFNRNFGVILSGPKGIGKSLCAKEIANFMVDSGYPVIIVQNYIPGIANFINEINQEVCVLFDEYDKTFKYNPEGDNSAQAEMLSLFDGLSVGKKMFVITCNDIFKLDSYLINRPGRFHYHFRFDYLSSDEIREYLMDNLKSDFYEEIDNVILFAKKVNLNYDCLRAIAFELSLGVPFKEAIEDLNIMAVKSESYLVTVYFEDGSYVRARDCLNFFSAEKQRIALNDNDVEQTYFIIEFRPKECYFDKDIDLITIDGNKVIATWDDEDGKTCIVGKKKINKVTFKASQVDKYSYNLKNF